MVNGIDNNLNIYFNEWKNVTDSIFASGIVRSSLKRNAQSYSEKIEISDSINDYIMNLVGGRGDMTRICLYNNSGETVYEYNVYRLNNITPEENSVLGKLKSTNSSFTIVGPRYQEFSSGNKRYMFTIGRQIKDTDTGKDIGYLVIDIDYNMLVKTIAMSKSNGTNTLVITDKNGDVVYNSEKISDINTNYENTGTYKKFAENKSTLAVDLKSSNFDWNYKMISTREAMLARLTKVSVFFIIIGCASFIIFLICSILISRSVSKPLRRLEATMETAESNNFNEILPVTDSYEEVNRLTARFNVMLVEIQRLLDKEKESWRREAESEYKALQLQITPHFLYNSLDSINCLAQVNGQKEISKMVLSLAGIFKYSMKYGSNIATLEDEINHVKNYCMLQAVHYQDSFRIEYDVSEEYLPRKVVKFMLQPIVENAINHGLKEKEMGSLIKISAYEDDGEFIVSVFDNGAGMTKERAERLRNTLALPSPQLFEIDKGGKHIGLSNVNLRLKLQYGEKAGITFETEENEGTEILIHIPISD